MKDGFVLSACAVPHIRVADTAHNADEAVRLIAAAKERGVTLLVFPALTLTGATAGDLLSQPALLNGARDALKKVADSTKGLNMLICIGLPFAHGERLYNCAATIFGGRILGLTAMHVPNPDMQPSRFSAAPDGTIMVSLYGESVPLGGDLVFVAAEMPSVSVAVRGADADKANANILAVLDADNEGAGRAEYRRTRMSAASGQTASAIVYANAGAGESTTDLVFSGHSMIVENGTLLAESPLFASGLTAVCEIDTAFLAFERMRGNAGGAKQTQIPFSCPVVDAPLCRTFSRTPFVPAHAAEVRDRAALILEIQARGLYTRLQHTGSKALVIGVSGGLDSTLALFVCVRAAALLGFSPDCVKAVTMPCFGTGTRTRNNAEALCKALHMPLETIDITAAVRAHFADIGQSDKTHDTAYENAQARMRTMVLMNRANQLKGLVVGTGDLSEAALGFSTYNGDHMSMYGVNAGVPKTLIRHLIRFEADRIGEDALKAVVTDILDTPVSPELLPAKKDAIVQQTESIVGPYELHDFFMYHTLRRGAAPKKLMRIACGAFSGSYAPKEIHAWLTVFYKRFFAQAFKRSCTPDAPAIGSVSLSPRAGWRMPSDASAALYLAELEECKPK